MTESQWDRAQQGKLGCHTDPEEERLKDAVVIWTMLAYAAVPDSDDYYRCCSAQSEACRQLVAHRYKSPSHAMPSRGHSIERTSPKGEPFVGTCRLCGVPGLKMPFESECENVRGLSRDEALLEAISGGHKRSYSLDECALRLQSELDGLRLAISHYSPPSPLHIPVEAADEAIALDALRQIVDIIGPSPLSVVEHVRHLFSATPIQQEPSDEEIIHLARGHGIAWAGMVALRPTVSETNAIAFARTLLAKHSKAQTTHEIRYSNIEKAAEAIYEVMPLRGLESKPAWGQPDTTGRQRDARKYAMIALTRGPV